MVREVRLLEFHILSYTTYKLVVAYALTMAGRRYTNLPFYRSTDPEEFLEWQEQMEIELEFGVF